MTVITLTIDRGEVLTALMRTTGYIGAKQLDTDRDAYRRISLSDDDRQLLETFWQESREKLCLTLRRLIDAEGLEGDIYRIDLNLSGAFDTSLTATLESSAKAFFIQYMAAKWLSITDRVSASAYADAAASCLTDIGRYAYCKRRPQRPALLRGKR